VKSESAHRLEGIGGDALELEVVFQNPQAGEFGLDVLCDKHGENGLRVSILPESNILRLGNVNAPFALKPGEDLQLRVFVDKNLVEVFANNRQAAAAARKYDPASLAVSLFSKGGDIQVREIRSWRLRSIYAAR